MSPLVSVNGVAKAFNGKRVFSGITFSAAKGEALGVIGPNGAGKTTLLRIVMGLLQVDAGNVRVDGEPVPSALRRVRAAYFAGASTLPPLVRVHAWRSLFHDAEEVGEHRQFRVLSRGTRQLLGLRTLFSISGLRLIVLDEPWEGLDPDASRWLTEAMRARRDAGATLVVASHRLHDLAGVCDRYIFLDRGFATMVRSDAVSRHGLVTGDTLVAAFDAVRRRGR